MFFLSTQLKTSSFSGSIFVICMNRLKHGCGDSGTSRIRGLNLKPAKKPAPISFYEYSWKKGGKRTKRRDGSRTLSASFSS